MVVATQIFIVVTEFKFEAAQAFIASDLLSAKVQGISNAADNALASVERLGFSFALQFTGAGGGILGVLGKAITASDDFTQSQLSFANIISSNLEFLTGSVDNFSDRMLSAKAIMNDIIKDSAKFGLPAKQLLGLTKGISALLVPKGLAGKNFEAARTISRNLLKSAPNLGIDPTLVQGQLVRAIEGAASAGDTLFRRLRTEAPEAFQRAGVTDTKSFNVLKAAKRFEILNEALGKFSSDVEILTARANTLGAIFQRIKDLFSGFASVLKPLGDVIIPPLVQILELGIKIIQDQGAILVKQFADFIKPMIENPKKLIIGLLQVKSLAADLGKATVIAGVVVLFTQLGFISALLSKSALFAGLGTALAGIAGSAGILSLIFSKISFIFKTIIPFLGTMFFAFVKVASGVAFLTLIFQAFSRALAIAKFDRIGTLIEQSPLIGAALLKLSQAFNAIMAPVNFVIEGLAQIFLLFLDTGTSVNILSGALTFLSDIMVSIANTVTTTFAGIRAIAAGVLQFIADIITRVGNAFDAISVADFSGAIEALTGGIADSLENVGTSALDEFFKTIRENIIGIEQNTENAAVVNNEVNIGKIEIRNDFKEQLNPDRIAFTIKDQIMKTANNPTQARNQSFTNGLRAGTGVQAI